MPMGTKGKSNGLAGKAVGVSAQTVHRAEAIMKHGVPELAEAVRAGEITVRAATDIATLPEKEQRVIVAGGAEAVGSALKRIRRNEEPLYPTKTHPVDRTVSEAFTFAQMALSQLSRIRSDDPERTRQLQRVRDWIDLQLAEQEEVEKLGSARDDLQHL